MRTSSTWLCISLAFLVQLPLGAVPTAELLSFAGFVHLKFIGVSKYLAIGAPA
jgi:hypothetical protein